VDPQDHFRLAAGYTSNPEQPFECEFTRKDGSIVVLQVHALAHFDASHVDFICIDITDRTQAERALLEGEEHLHSLLDNSPNLICLKDPDGRFLFLNKQYKELFDLTTEDAAGKTAHDLFPEPVAEQAIAHDRAVIESRTAIIREETGMPSKEGVFRDFICCKFPLFGLDDRITAIATIRTDITERRAAQRKLEQAEKLQAMGQLTGGIAHDFNNLLAVVRVNAELMQQRYGPSDKSIAAVLHATSCASDLIGRLLSFARKQPLDLQTIDIGEVVQEVCRLVERNVGPLVEIAIDIEPHVWPALADPVALQTALLNLVFNARDAMPESGRLTIACRNETIEADPVAPAAQAGAGEYVAIAVHDTGTGMDAESLARACEPFYTTKDMSRGTGLGLSVVYGFVQQMGGHLHIESSESAGTTVRLCLPRAAVAARPHRSDPAGAIATSGGHERILIVEDDPDLRAAVVRMLRSYGYSTVEACDARMAAAMFMSEPPIDLVLTDIVLPKGKSGPEVIADLRRSQPDLKAVFMSGYSDPCDALVKSLGSDAVVLKKPFHGDQLANALRQTLDSHRAAGVASTAT
jgi:PAS domain S-box-containing protein